MFSDCWAID